MNILLQVDHSSEQCYIFFYLSLQDFFAVLCFRMVGGMESIFFSFIKNQRIIMEVKRDDTHLLSMDHFLFGLMHKDILKTLEVLFECPVTLTLKQKLQHWVSLIGQ